MLGRLRTDSSPPKGPQRTWEQDMRFWKRIPPGLLSKVKASGLLEARDSHGRTAAQVREDFMTRFLSFLDRTHQTLDRLDGGVHCAPPAPTPARSGPSWC